MKARFAGRRRETQSLSPAASEIVVPVCIAGGTSLNAESIALKRNRVFSLPPLYKFGSVLICHGARIVLNPQRLD